MSKEPDLLDGPKLFDNIVVKLMHIHSADKGECFY